MNTARRDISTFVPPLSTTPSPGLGLFILFDYINNIYYYLLLVFHLATQEIMLCSSILGPKRTRLEGVLGSLSGAEERGRALPVRSIQIAGQETSHPLVGRTHELLSREVADKTAAVEQSDYIGNAQGPDNIVTDDQEGNAQALLHLQDQLVDGVGHQGIESGVRLIEEEEAWAQDDRSGQADPFPHSTG